MILRTYGCENCGHFLEVELRADQWDQEPPECPHCTDAVMGQAFKPPAITGSHIRRATDLAYDIAEKDYGVADMTPNKGGPPTVRYKDAAPPAGASTWSANTAALEQAVALGRENRLRFGSGLEALQTSLKNGTQPDLIEMSKKRSIRGW